MSYKIKNVDFLNDDRVLLGISTAGINTALYVGDSAANLITLDGETGNIDVSGTSTLDGNVTLGADLSFASGTAEEIVSGITTDLTTSAGANELVTAGGAKSYVDQKISETGGTLTFGNGITTSTVDISTEIFTIEGTNLEIETSASGQTLTIGLTNDVSIGGSMTANDFYGNGAFLTGIGGNQVDLSGTDQSFDTLILTEGSGASTGYGLTVNSDANIKGNLVMEGQIHGPATFVIDPEVIGNATGTVVIRGDLVVEGTEFIVNSETLQIADKQIGLATNITTPALLQDSGFTFGQPGSPAEQSFLYDFSTNSLVSSVGLAVTDGGAFKAGANILLTKDTLGGTVLDSSLTSVGELTDLTVAGDITANGNITGDSSTVISGIASVIATDFYGNGSGITGINAGSVDLSGTHQSFGSLELTGVGVALTVTNNADINATLSAKDISVTDTILPSAPNGGTVGNITTRFGDVFAVAGDFGVLDANYIEVGLGLSFTGGDADEIVSGITTNLDESFGANELVTAEGVKDYVDGAITGGGSVQASTINTADNQDDAEYSVSFVSTTGDGASVYTDASQLKYNPFTGLLVAQDFNSLSDIRYKDNVETIDGAVAKLQQLRGVEFDWKHSPGSSVGVIAQEVMEVYPQLVTEGEEKITVNYNGLVGLLVQAVKEQREQIASLQEKLG